MKKRIFTLFLTIGLVMSVAANTFASNHIVDSFVVPDEYYQEDRFHGVFLKINDPRMYLSNFIGSLEFELDSSPTTVPIIKNNRTLMPVSKLVKELGGKVAWEAASKKVTLELDGNRVELWIGKTTAVVNGKNQTLDVAPTTINGRTMLPIRFVSASLGLELQWLPEYQMIILYRPWFKSEMPLYPEVYNSLFEPLEVEEPVVTEPSNPEPVSNSNDPIDSKGRWIHVTDIVSVGMFSGEVLQVNGNKVLVYWDTKSHLVPKGDEGFWASILGIRYLANSWIDASSVTVVSSGY